MNNIDERAVEIADIVMREWITGGSDKDRQDAARLAKEYLIENPAQRNSELAVRVATEMSTWRD